MKSARLHRKEINPYQQLWQIFMDGETCRTKKLSNISYIMEEAFKNKRAFYLESKPEEGEMVYYITLMQNTEASMKLPSSKHDNDEVDMGQAEVKPQRRKRK